MLNRYKSFLIYGLLGLLLLLYLPALDIYLLQDDFIWLESTYAARQNPQLVLEKINHFFRPLVKVVYLLSFAVFKTAAPLYIMCLLLIHLANVFLFYRLMTAMSANGWLPVLAAGLFGYSSLYSEAVLYCAGGFPDVLLMFFMLLTLVQLKRAASVKSVGLISVTAFCALGCKESWVILPFLCLGYLLLIRQLSWKRSLLLLLPQGVLLAAYGVIFFLLPFLQGKTVPSNYAGAGLGEAFEKAVSMLLQFIGVSAIGNTNYMVLALIVLIGLLVLMRLIYSKNYPALWGLTVLVLGIGLSMFIHYMPNRYNYIPLLGFWVLVCFFINQEINTVKQKFPQFAKIIYCIAAAGCLLYGVVQVRSMQTEISDYRFYGDFHRQLVQMFQTVQPAVDHSIPILFINRGQKKVVVEAIDHVKGHEKVFYARGYAPWQLIPFEALVNFTGQPFQSPLLQVKDKKLQKRMLDENLQIVIFSDQGFSLAQDENIMKSVCAYFDQNQSLPNRVGIYKFADNLQKTPQTE
jgi:hypothetical protein